MSGARYLLDTHVLLWAMAGDPRLSEAHRHIIGSGEDIVISVISIWEIAVKISIGKLHFEGDVARIAYDRSIPLLPIDERHAAAIRDLPLHHRDPFDRMLIAQSRIENLHILTNDHRFKDYDVAVL